MNFIFYPAVNKLYKPGILLDSNDGFLSLSGLDINFIDNDNIHINGGYIKIISGSPRIISIGDAALRLFTFDDALRRMYSIYPDYRSQSTIYQKIFNEIGPYTGKFVISDFYGFSPLLVIEETDIEYKCLLSIDFNKNFVPILDIRYVPKESDSLQENDALCWLWTNNECHLQALRTSKPYKFITDIIKNFK